jgi:hypothetical protein
MNRRDYYEIFGISPAASQKEITQAYRRLARRFHPDLQPTERKRWAEEKMKRLNEAYAVLGDPEARRRYTATILSRVGSTSLHQHWAASPSDIWFGGFPRRRTCRQKSERWQKISTILDFVFWMLVIDFLVIGAVLMAVNWNGMVEILNSGHAAGLQCLFLGVWWVMLVAALFKMVPLRR